VTTSEVVAGPKGAILHVNRQHIAQNIKDGGRRPVYTLKPNGPNSQAVYAREVTWNGAARAVFSDDRLACGARAWIAVEPGVTMILDDPMTFSEAKAAA
jgi:hypothetical protein